MWVVFDEKKNEIIAFHKNKKVVKRYISQLKKSNQNISFSLSLLKMKDKKARKIKYFNDRYLTRYHNTYVQYSYYAYLEIITGTDIYDEQYVLDILERTAVNPNLSKNDVNAIKKVISIFDNMLSSDSKYTMTLDQLKSVENDYAHYYYHNVISPDDL